MLFGEKLRFLRVSSKMSQTDLAKELGISLRTVQNYESCRSYPKKTELYARIAGMFKVTVDYLLSESDRYSTVSDEKSGAKAAHEIKELIAEVGGIFSDEGMADEDKEKIIRTINDLYWKAKDNSRKHNAKRILPEYQE